MKYVNGELLLETPEEIQTAIAGVKCLNATAKFALANSQKALPYAHAMSTPQELAQMRENVKKFEGMQTSTNAWMDAHEKAAPAKGA